MAVRVLCSNPNCGASFSVDPSNLGKGQRCRNCGWLIDPDAPSPEGQPFVQPMPVSPMEPGINLPNPFAGRYKLVKVLGRGGMGAVYLAQDTQLKRQVALKVPLISADEDPDFLKRFQREAYALAQFHHPNICSIHDVGNHEGQPYLVMAYIEGSPLSEYVKRRKLPFEPAKAVRLVRVVAMALQKAHEAGIIHRDLKPSNIMISREGRPVIMDFGVARRDDPEESLRTRTGQMMGTPAYMPLEQFRGDVHSMGPGCDIYSLGVILYQLLTGRLPYEGSHSSVLEKLLTSRPAPPSSLRPGLDREIEAICLKAMAREIEDRYVSMTEFAQALGGYLERVSGPSSGGDPTAVIEGGPGKMVETEDGRKAAVVGADRDSQRTLPDHHELIPSDSPLPQTEPLRRRIKVSRHWIYAGLLGSLSLLGIIIYIVTDIGTVKITGTDPNMAVRVDGKQVRIENLGEPIALRTGAHELLVTRGELVVTTRSFQIERGKERILEVTFTPKPATELAKTQEEPATKAEETRTLHSDLTKDSEQSATETAASGGTTATKTEEIRTPLSSVAKPSPGFAESLGIKIVPIPSGEFWMGSSPAQIDLVLRQNPDLNNEYTDREQPRHRVQITKLQGLSAHEVTLGQFRRFVADSGYETEAERDGKGGWGFNSATGKLEPDAKYTWRSPGFEQPDDHPVGNVSWNDATEFCRWLSRKDGRSYRLPTEAEWEYACRAGTDTLYANGDDPERLALVGNVADAQEKEHFPGTKYAIAADDGFVFTSPVGRFAPNAWELYDMHGNVWEWCLDNYDVAYYKNSPAVDPQGPAEASFRVIRGGSWSDGGWDCRSASRYGYSPGIRYDRLGFRVARVPSD